jgi:hypothetical protein
MKHLQDKKGKGIRSLDAAERPSSISSQRHGQICRRTTIDGSLLFLVVGRFTRHVDQTSSDERGFLLFERYLLFIFQRPLLCSGPQGRTTKSFSAVGRQGILKKNKISLPSCKITGYNTYSNDLFAQ